MPRRSSTRPLPTPRPRLRSRLALPKPKVPLRPMPPRLEQRALPLPVDRAADKADEADEADKVDAGTEEADVVAVATGAITRAGAEANVAGAVAQKQDEAVQM